MQPYTAAFAQANLTPHERQVEIGVSAYRARVGSDEGYVLEQSPAGECRHPITHVLGGKNVYYFLTPYERGRLQTLPLAYDVRERKWFDTAASGVRHFPGGRPDTPLSWTDPMYTFNTSCYGCHVSQLSTNYDLKTDTYRTTWAEPGINCETCHGAAQAHVNSYQKAEETGVEPNDLGLISTREFSVEQTNSMCNSCHAKTSPITASFTPSERYFDHFDLVTLEHPDFYPDGRDLGENYTMATWRQSPCVQAGQLDCMHCHTSSGRYRFEEPQEANAACLPCHESRVQTVAAHSHHDPNQAGARCVSCHMPTTRFARMDRTDHSMRPPVPVATIRYESPNACNLCHRDEDATWAQRYVTDWQLTTRQERYLQLADYVDRTRRQDWSRLDEILAYVRLRDREEIVTASLLRLLRTCDDERKWPILVALLQRDTSPLVRTAAAEAMEGSSTAASLGALAAATADEYRLVRVRAAAALIGVPLDHLKEEYRGQVQRAIAELIESCQARQDDYASHYNLGNIQYKRRDYEQASMAYHRAIKLRPNFVPAYANMAFVHYALGQKAKADGSFRQALAVDPNNAAVHLNRGMLLAELERLEEAEEAFRAALQADPNLAAAAYNLGVLLMTGRAVEGLDFCRRAFRLQPNEGKYGYTYAYFLHRQGDTTRGIAVLEGMVSRKVPYPDAYTLLATIYLQHHDPQKAASVYEAASANENLPAYHRQTFATHAQKLK